MHALLEARIAVIEDILNNVVTELQDALSTQEQMIATVATGYAELTVLVDAIIATIDHRDNEDEITIFTKTIENKRKEMLDVLSNFSGNQAGSMEPVSSE